MLMFTLCSAKVQRIFQEVYTRKLEITRENGWRTVSGPDHFSTLVERDGCDGWCDGWGNWCSCRALIFETKFENSAANKTTGMYHRAITTNNTTLPEALIRTIMSSPEQTINSKKHKTEGEAAIIRSHVALVGQMNDKLLKLNNAQTKNDKLKYVRITPRSSI